MRCRCQGLLDGLCAKARVRPPSGGPTLKLRTSGRWSLGGKTRLNVWLEGRIV